MLAKLKQLLSPRVTLFILVLNHVSGFIGIHSSFSEWFIAMTPINLLVSLVLILIHQKNWNTNLVLAIILSSVIGFMVEVIGVKTSLIFGTYWYGETLGWKLLEVPLMIGINWTLLSYSTASIASYWKTHWVVQSALAAALMVALDWLIEPVAMKLDFWQWQNDTVPLQNYVGWYLTAFVVQLIYHRLKFDKSNKVAVYLFVVQALFFLAFKFIS